MREARRLATVLAACLLAAGTQMATARADGGGGTATSTCTAPGMTTVPMLGGGVTLGLPISVDPGTQTLSLQDAVVCTTLPNPSGGMLIDESVVVPAVDDQGAAPAQGVDCTPSSAATVTAQCSALARPLVTVSPPTDGANALGLAVSVPLVLCVAMAGSYAIDMTIENVVLTAVFGVIGYLMIRFDYPRLTIVIALVLGASAERNFHQSMLMSDGSWGIYIVRPICLVLLAGIVVLLALPIARGLAEFAGRKTSAQEG